MSRALDPVRVLRARGRTAHLDRSGADAVSVTGALVALHATDPATMYLSVAARLPVQPIFATVDRLKAAMEEERSLARLLGMRRTMHVVRRELTPAVQRLAKERLDGQRRKDVAKYLKHTQAPDLDALRPLVLAALEDGDLDSAALSARVPDLARRIVLAEDKSYAGAAPVSRYVLEAMGTGGDLMRARSPGGWRASGTTWARLDRWMPDLPPVPSKERAYEQLVSAYLAAFGPGSIDDMAWWGGLPKGEVSAALSRLGPQVVEVEVHGWPGPRYAIAGQVLEDDGPPLPPALLPALDPSAMCTNLRAPFLNPDISGPLFDYSGNIAPTIWVDGRIVGGWACRPDGSVAWQILDESARGHGYAVQQEVARLEASLQGEVVAPRFPSPLVRTLAGSQRV